MAGLHWLVLGLKHHTSCLRRKDQDCLFWWPKGDWEYRWTVWYNSALRMGKNFCICRFQRWKVIRKAVGSIAARRYIRARYIEGFEIRHLDPALTALRIRNKRTSAEIRWSWSMVHAIMAISWPFEDAERASAWPWVLKRTEVIHDSAGRSDTDKLALDSELMVFRIFIAAVMVSIWRKNGLPGEGTSIVKQLSSWCWKSSGLRIWSRIKIPNPLLRLSLKICYLHPFIWTISISKCVTFPKLS